MISNEADLAIDLRGLTKRYGKTTAVDNLNLGIRRGTTFGLLGPNGAGKSTTIKMLMGMLTISEGEAIVLGVDVSRNPAPMKLHVGYVPESHFIYSWARVGDIIGFVKSFYPTWNDVRCHELLELFELSPKKKVRHLSKGMLAKLSLLLAISHEPDLLVLDEPMTGLDPIVREEFLDGAMTTICRGESTVLFSSHTLDDVQRLADEVGIIYGGKLLVHRRLDELLASTKRLSTVLRNGAAPHWRPEETIWQKVEDRQWRLTVGNFSEELLAQLRERNTVGDIEVADVTLEELFKDYVRGASQTE